MPALNEPRWIKAGNRGPFTLDGTRTFLVGNRQLAIIDPGPEVDDHLRALVDAASRAREVRLLLTHGHGDHAAAAQELARRLRASVHAHPSAQIPGVSSAGREDLREGHRIQTDHGDLVVVETPGHTRDHLAFHWQDARSVFVGDLVLGKGSTTWVGEYLGSVQDYLDSLTKVRGLGPERLFPAHGPPVHFPASVLDAYRRHRLDRLEEVRGARALHPRADASKLVKVIYGGSLPDRLVKAAEASVLAMLFHLESGGRPEAKRG